jgi:ribosomal protein L11 methyltransferase
VTRSADARPWFAVRVRPRGGDEAADAVVGALFAAGSQGVQEEGDAVLTQFPPDSDIEAIRLAVLAADPTADVSIAVAELVDWTEGWKALIGAHELGGLAVVPPGSPRARPHHDHRDRSRGWRSAPATIRPPRRRAPDAGRVRPGDLVADLGAGSAVLSIAAIKLGAARAAAIEFDPDAIENAEAERGAQRRVRSE